MIMACRDVPELKNALFKPAKQGEELYSDLRSSIETSLNDMPPRQFLTNDQNDNDRYYLDRRYAYNRQEMYKKQQHRKL